MNVGLLYLGKVKNNLQLHYHPVNQNIWPYCSAVQEAEYLERY